MRGQDQALEQTRPYANPDGWMPSNRTRPDANLDRTMPPANPLARYGLPEIVRAFKSFSARRINANRHLKGVPVWQRNYYEHIIRDETDLLQIAAYIHANPARWDQDQLHPDAPLQPFNQENQ